MRYTALISSSKLQAASYLALQSVGARRSRCVNVQVVVGARVGFIFLFELPLHRRHVIRCGMASNIAGCLGTLPVTLTCTAKSSTCSGKQQL
jgi:hypothetical protein